MNMMRESLFAVLLHGALAPAFAQSIPVTTPKLPPRSAAPAGAQPPTGYVQTQPQARPPTVQAAAPGAAYANTQPGMQGGAVAQPGAYSNPAPQGSAYAAYAPAAPAAPAVTPQRAAAGNCRAQPTPDRQTLMLVTGAEALARAHVPLGEFRAQQVVHSPDGRWAVAYTKLRGVAQYAAMTIDLERCEVQRVIELNAAGEDVTFEGDEAVLRLAGGERRVGLRDGRVR